MTLVSKAMAGWRCLNGRREKPIRGGASNKGNFARDDLLGGRRALKVKGLEVKMCRGSDPLLVAGRPRMKKDFHRTLLRIGGRRDFQRVGGHGTPLKEMKTQVKKAESYVRHGKGTLPKGRSYIRNVSTLGRKI